MYCKSTICKSGQFKFNSVINWKPLNYSCIVNKDWTGPSRYRMPKPSARSVDLCGQGYRTCFAEQLLNTTGLLLRHILRTGRGGGGQGGS